MNKIVKTFAVLALLILLTIPALGAYNVKNDYSVAPDAAFYIKTEQFDRMSPLLVTAVDVSTGGPILWKKWYVDGHIVSTDSTQKVLNWEFNYNGPRNAYSTFETHHITLRVANRANAQRPSEFTLPIYVYP